MTEVQDKYKEPVEEEMEPVALKGEPQLDPKFYKDISKESPIEESPDSKEIKQETLAEVKDKIETPVQEIEKEVAPPVSAAVPSSKAKDEIDKLKDSDRQTQVKSLCDLAFQKGLDFAIEVAKGLNNAYILDEFHDNLVDKLYKKLIEKGELKEL